MLDAWLVLKLGWVIYLINASGFHDSLELTLPSTKSILINGKKVADPLFYQKGAQENAEIKSKVTALEGELAKAYQRWEYSFC